MIIFKQEATLKEFIAAHYLHLRPRRLIGILGSILLGLFLATLIMRWCRPSGLDTADRFATFGVVWLLLYFVLLYFVAFLPYRLGSSEDVAEARNIIAKGIKKKL